MGIECVKEAYSGVPATCQMKMAHLSSSFSSFYGEFATIQINQAVEAGVGPGLQSGAAPWFFEYSLSNSQAAATVGKTAVRSERPAAGGSCSRCRSRLAISKPLGNG